MKEVWVLVIVHFENSVMQSITTVATSLREVMEQELGALITDKSQLCQAMEGAMSEIGYGEENGDDLRIYYIRENEVFQHHNQGLRGLTG